MKRNGSIGTYIPQKIWSLYMVRDRTRTDENLKYNSHEIPKSLLTQLLFYYPASKRRKSTTKKKPHDISITTAVNTSTIRSILSEVGVSEQSCEL